MGFRRFEDLPVWKAAARLYVGVAELTDDAAVRRKGGFADQLERAALSVSNNIAEGFEAGTTEQLLRFLYIAKGSAAECRSLLTVASALSHLAHQKARVEELRAAADEIGRQLGGWSQQLQNSGMRGIRHVNDGVREGDARRTRREEFLAMLQRTMEEGRRKREEEMAKEQGQEQKEGEGK